MDIPPDGPGDPSHAEQGITIERILTDNGNGYRSIPWRERCAELAIKHSRTKPYRPATNGKVERFNRTLGDCDLSPTDTRKISDHVSGRPLHD